MKLPLLVGALFAVSTVGSLTSLEGQQRTQDAHTQAQTVEAPTDDVTEIWEDADGRGAELGDDDLAADSDGAGVLGDSEPPALIPWTVQDVLDAIAVAGPRHGVSVVLLRCISWNESKYWPYAVSKTNDHGSFQFHIEKNGSTLMDRTPYPGSPYDPELAANAAAWLIARGYLHQWATWRLCA